VKNQQRRNEAADKDDDRAYIVCMPVATGAAIPGSSQRNCSRCAEPIWVSPGTLKSVAQFPDRQFICVQCALKFADFEEALQAPTAEQMEELRANLPASAVEGRESPPSDPQQLLHELKEIFRPLQQSTSDLTLDQSKPHAGKSGHRGHHQN
jgi:hypothetical protein